MNNPTIGRIAHYVLSESDVEQIKANRDRAGSGTFAGNPVAAGDIVPAIIVRMWSESTGCMNGQAFLDGNDSYWLMSRSLDEGRKPGTWHWPDRS